MANKPYIDIYSGLLLEDKEEVHITSVTYTASEPIDIKNHNLNLKIDNKTLKVDGSGQLHADFSKDLIEDTSADIVIEQLVPATAYQYGELNSLTISSVEKSTVESTIEFTAGNNFKLDLPDTLQTIGDLTFIASIKYILAIYNNILIVGEIN